MAVCTSCNGRGWIVIVDDSDEPADIDPCTICNKIDGEGADERAMEAARAFIAGHGWTIIENYDGEFVPRGPGVTGADWPEEKQAIAEACSEILSRGH